MPCIPNLGGFIDLLFNQNAKEVAEGVVSGMRERRKRATIRPSRKKAKYRNLTEWQKSWDVVLDPYDATIRSRKEDDIEWQAAILHDLFDNDFLKLSLDPDWLAWNTATIPRISQVIYDERQMPGGTLDPARMSILADALLDAGCSDEEVVQHCRSDKPHVRGCWLVDLILGKSC